MIVIIKLIFFFTLMLLFNEIKKTFFDYNDVNCNALLKYNALLLE